MSLVRSGLLAAPALAMACTVPHAVPVEPETHWSVSAEIRIADRTRADVLLVVDSSPSMVDELEVMPEQVRALVRELQAPAPRAEGEPPPVVEDLRVGVMTAGPEGQGGLLGVVDALGGGCDEEARPLWEEVAELAVLAPLDTPARYLLDATVQVLHGGDFVRDDSLLAVVIISDGDDDSPGSIEDLHHAVLSVRRPGWEDSIVLIAIVGIPLDGSWRPGDPVGDLRDLGLDPSCESEHASAALPPRLAELVYAFGDRGLLESICRTDWSGQLWNVLGRDYSRYGDICITQEVPEPVEDHCQVVLLRADGCGCGEGQRDHGLDEGGHRRCELVHGEAWYVEPQGRGCDGAALAVPGWRDLAPGSLLRLECRGDRW